MVMVVVVAVVEIAEKSGQGRAGQGRPDAKRLQSGWCVRGPEEDRRRRGALWSR